MFNNILINAWLAYLCFYLIGLPIWARKNTHLSRWSIFVEYSLNICFGITSIFGIIVGIFLLMHGLPVTQAGVLSLTVLGCHAFISILRTVLRKLAGLS